MMYWVLFIQFFKIGLLAIGGGMVTIPFLFDLSRDFGWFTIEELTDMIAVSQSTPGPVGVNMATYAGYKVLGFSGGIVATFGLVVPSVIISIIMAKILNKWGENKLVNEVMMSIRPAVVALILLAGYELLKVSVANYWELALSALLFGLIYFWKRSPIFYICLGAVLGIVLQL